MPNAVKLPHNLDRKTMTCRAVIETPKGSRSKFDYDEERGLFRLAGLLPEGMSFPLDFGFFPSTKAEDGDSLDVLVLHDEPLPVGALVTIRPIGVLSIRAPAAEHFKSARHFAAWLGLTPKDHSTGGRTRLGGITKAAGDPSIRTVLVVGATALLRHVRTGRNKTSPWLIAL